MVEQIQDINLIQVLDPKTVRRLLSSFTLATGLGANIADASGNPILLPHMQPCEFCQLIMSSERGRVRCTQSNARAGLQSAQLGEPYIFRCHAGLIEWSAPVMYEDKYLGAVFCGPVLMWDADELALGEIVFRVSDLGLPKDDIKARLEKITVMSGPSVQAAAELLFVIANQLTHSGMLTLIQRKELNEQQSRLAEEIHARKLAEEVLKDVEARATKPIYPLEMEQELLAKVKLGDRQGAKEILNEILGSIFFRSGCNTEVIKARVLELMVMLSRAAVEAGASMEKLLGLNYYYVEELSEIMRFEDLCAWIVKVLDTFLDVASEKRNLRNAKVISDAVEYIAAHYKDEITLEEVANAAHLSPYYLSHLFRSELSCTFIEYLTKVRIEKAKKLMKGTNMSLGEICEEVGYKDSSYFSKVFRKIEGIMPSKYRQQTYGG